MCIEKYEFPSDHSKLAENGYRLFSSDWEDDKHVVFHGTALANFESIKARGVDLTGASKCASFAKTSDGALHYACLRRNDDDGCIIVARFDSLDAGELRSKHRTFMSTLLKRD